VAEGGEVADREVHRGDVVVADEGRVDAVQIAVDQHDRQPALAQRDVAGRVGGAVGVQPGDEDDPGDAALQEHLGVVVLVDAAGGLGAQHRRVAVPRQRRLDDLRERREDRVVELRDDEPDEAGGPLLQPGRPLVAEDVEGGEHRLAGAVGDPGTAVEDPADRRLADAGLHRDVGQPSALVTQAGPVREGARGPESPSCTNVTGWLARSCTEAAGQLSPPGTRAPGASGTGRYASITCSDTKENVVGDLCTNRAVARETAPYVVLRGTACSTLHSDRPARSCR
jgi:hypothetical protein